MTESSPQTDPAMKRRPEDANPPEANPQDAAAQLVKKDRMIATLTERLAETADQLDRLQRMGLDRGGKATGGLPREIIEQQQLLTGKLSEFVERWDDAELLDRLLRMEQGIEDLLTAASTGGGQSSRTTESPPASQATRESGTNGSASVKSEKAEQGSYWEAAKARMLAQSESATPHDATAPPAQDKQALESLVAEHVATASAGASESPTEGTADAPSHEVLEQPPAPNPISADASLEELQKAVDSRDAYIAFLVSRLRHAEQQNVGPVDWNALNQAPEELVDRLKQLETQLKDQLARTEVAHSLERAALTRDRVRLHQIKQQVEQEIRRLGANTQKAEVQEKIEEKRLFRMIGRKKG